MRVSPSLLLCLFFLSLIQPHSLTHPLTHSLTHSLPLSYLPLLSLLSAVLLAFIGNSLFSPSLAVISYYTCPLYTYSLPPTYPSPSCPCSPERTSSPCRLFFLLAPSPRTGPESLMPSFTLAWPDRAYFYSLLVVSLLSAKFLHLFSHLTALPIFLFLLYFPTFVFLDFLVIFFARIIFQRWRVVGIFLSWVSSFTYSCTSRLLTTHIFCI